MLAAAMILHAAMIFRPGWTPAAFALLALVIMGLSWDADRRRLEGKE